MSTIQIVLLPLRVLGWTINLIWRMVLVVVLVSVMVFAGFVTVKGNQPLGVVGDHPKSVTADLGEITYWKFMADRLVVVRDTPSICQKTRLVALVMILPVYPILYTTVALAPDGYLSRHVQPSPLIPDPITWEQVPETWWHLVKEISWYDFSAPQLDYKPGIGQRVGDDKSCNLPPVQTVSK